MIFQDKSYTATTVAGRAAWLPWYDECTNGRGLLHLGLAGNYQQAWANQFPLAKGPDTRPEESHLGLPYNFTMTTSTTSPSLAASWRSSTARSPSSRSTPGPTPSGWTARSPRSTPATPNSAIF